MTNVTRAQGSPLPGDDSPGDDPDVKKKGILPCISRRQFLFMGAAAVSVIALERVLPGRIMYAQTASFDRQRIATLGELDEESLVKILMVPKNDLVKQYQLLFEMDDVRLKFSDSALQEIAHKAVDRKTGARGLRSIMEDILLETMFELPGLDGVEDVVINKEVVHDNVRPLYIYTDRRDDLDSSA